MFVLQRSLPYLISIEQNNIKPFIFNAVFCNTLSRDTYFSYYLWSMRRRMWVVYPFIRSWNPAKKYPIPKTNEVQNTIFSPFFETDIEKFLRTLKRPHLLSINVKYECIRLPFGLKNAPFMYILVKYVTSISMISLSSEKISILTQII